MIVKAIDFTNLFKRIEPLFFADFGNDKYLKIKKPVMDSFKELAQANLTIYQANMKALEFRQENHHDPWVYSRLEFEARQAGERRVKAKIIINRLIHDLCPGQGRGVPQPESWMSDDIVYSVAEMIDRLTIEEIKQEDYRLRIHEGSPADRKELEKKINLSSKLSRAVEECLGSKLQEINRKNYYERIEETRTYNTQGRFKSMILEDIDFSPLFKKLEQMFLNKFLVSKIDKIRNGLMKEIRTLAKANFLCYQANMKIIESRRGNVDDPKVYSDLDWQVRVVGEYRVLAKSRINHLISSVFDRRPVEWSQERSWMTNDVVYSIADMIDRLIIEFIKIADFQLRLHDGGLGEENTQAVKSKIDLATEWSRRVERYLGWKLKEINNKGYYQCLPETRTYNLNDLKDINSFLKKD